MKLSKVSINNYRSVASMEITFPLACQALIGVNESGKSNILRALSLIDPSTSVTAADLRIERRGEAEVKVGNVDFVFELDDADVLDNAKALLDRVDPRSADAPFVKIAGHGQMTISEFALTRRQGIYEVKLPEGKRSPNYYALPAERYEVLPGWVHNSTDQPYSVSERGETTVIPPKGYAKLASPDCPKPLEPATADGVNSFLGARIRSVVQQKLPKCIFWKYSDQHLLPSSLDINAFVANPDTCIPLRSMFELAGYRGDAIGEAIKKAKASAPHRYIQLLRNVQDAATNHVREVWQDHKHVQIELQPNGDSLHPIISDESVPLDMANRSDGFKRFVSFLLQVSAKVRSEQLRDVLLLIDEPEIGLHPGGAKSLTKELIKVGQSNTVMYSTHSIFMVDKKQVDRHIIVEKKNEVTIARRAEKSRMQDDEVLYAAMGYSIFEVLKERNVIFEGWRDKEIFRIVGDSMAKGDKDLRGVLSGIGLTHAEGVKDVKHVSSFLELAGRSCLIISDADTAAHEKRKQYTKIGAWGKWVTLRDVLGPDTNATTGEDLISHPAIVKRANKWRGKVPNLAALSENQLTNRPALSALAAWIATAGLAADEKEEALDDLKYALFESLKRDEISDQAAKLVEYVAMYDFGSKAE